MKCFSVFAFFQEFLAKDGTCSSMIWVDLQLPLPSLRQEFQLETRSSWQCRTPLELLSISGKKTSRRKGKRRERKGREVKRREGKRREREVKEEGNQREGRARGRKAKSNEKEKKEEEKNQRRRLTHDDIIAGTTTSGARLPRATTLSLQTKPPLPTPQVDSFTGGTMRMVRRDGEKKKRTRRRQEARRKEASEKQTGTGESRRSKKLIVPFS